MHVASNRRNGGEQAPRLPVLTSRTPMVNSALQDDHESHKLSYSPNSAMLARTQHSPPLRPDCSASKMRLFLLTLLAMVLVVFASPLNLPRGREARSLAAPQPQQGVRGMPSFQIPACDSRRIEI